MHFVKRLANYIKYVPNNLLLWQSVKKVVGYKVLQFINNEDQEAPGYKILGVKMR